MVKIRKSEKQKAEDFMSTLVFKVRAKVTCTVEHKIAVEAVKAGLAKITKKKNYGRISEIEYVENDAA